MAKFSTLLLLGLLGIALVYPVVANDPDLITDLGTNSTWPADYTFTGFRNPTLLGAGQASLALAAASAGLPGLKGLGLAAVFFEFGPGSQIDPHYHPRATEIFYVTSGTIGVGFVTTANIVVETTVQAGDLFVFPKGLPHYQRNDQKTTGAGYSVLSSENPGVLLIANALFASTGGGFPDNVLASALKTSEDTVTEIKAAFA